MKQRNKFVSLTKILIVLVCMTAVSLETVAASSTPPPDQRYIPGDINVVDTQNGTKTTTVSVFPYQVNWTLSVYNGLGDFRITGSFGDGGSFTWVNCPPGNYYPYHQFAGSTGTYNQTWSQTNQGRTTYDHTTVYKQ